jgi:hypothetical protein
VLKKCAQPSGVETSLTGNAFVRTRSRRGA